MIKIFSFGGGIQSVAALVLQTTGDIHYDAFVFANVGAESENPDTLDYFYNHAVPFAEKNGIRIVEVFRTRKGERETLMDRIARSTRHSPLPVYGSITGAPQPRRCTYDFKIEVVARWIKQQGHREARVGLGISTDEIYRVKQQKPNDVLGITEYMEYPLIDLRLSRNDCFGIIGKSGLPIPPKSACFFCPYMSVREWSEMKMQRPDLFNKAVEVEKIIQKKYAEHGVKGTYYLHRSGKPLEVAVGEQMNFLEELENCESGYCMV